MTTHQINGLRSDRLLPLIDTDDTELALASVAVLSHAGYRLVEIAMRHPNSYETLAEALTLTHALTLTQALTLTEPAIQIGAGTVVNPSILERVERMGAKFVVSPGITERLLDAMIQCEVPALPGIATPSEIMSCLDRGFDTVKVFPADRVGLGTVAAWRGPFPTVSFVATGGITTNNISGWLDQPAVVAVGGGFPTQLDRLRNLDRDGAVHDATSLLARWRLANC